MKHVLIVGSGGPIAERLHRGDTENVRTSVLCRTASLARLRDPNAHARVIAVANDARIPVWIEAARQVHNMESCDAIACYGERDQDVAAAIAQSLGLEWHSPETVYAVHDKVRMRDVLNAAGFPSIQHARPAGLAELEEFVRVVGGSVIVKPVDGAASTGVSLVRHSSEIPEAWRRATAAGEWAGTGVAAEEYLRGPLVTVECVSEGGRHVMVGTSAACSTPTRFVGIGHVSPAPVSAEVVSRMGRYVHAMLDALGVKAGPTHTELVLTKAGPQVVETHVRAAGDGIPALVQDVTGVDIFQCAVDATLGIPVVGENGSITSSTPVAAASAIWFLAVSSPGKLVKVFGEKEARAMPGVTEVRVDVSSGEWVEPLASSSERLGQVRAVGATSEQALQRVRAAASEIRFVIDATREPNDPTV